jgi:hypothetical protein
MNVIDLVVLFFYSFCSGMYAYYYDGCMCGVYEYLYVHLIYMRTLIIMMGACAA